MYAYFLRYQWWPWSNDLQKQSSGRHNEITSKNYIQYQWVTSAASGAAAMFNKSDFTKPMPNVVEKGFSLSYRIAFLVAVVDFAAISF